MENNFRAAERFNGISERFWEEMYSMAQKNKPVHLGVGCPDFSCQPQSIKDAMIQVSKSSDSSLHQYARGYGHPRLVNSIAKLYSKLLNHEINGLSDILITFGAYEALYCSVMGMVNPGDEVIIIDPHYDFYVPVIQIAGGIPVAVPLREIKNNSDIKSSKDWVLDNEELKSKFNSKTRMIIINTPHNPIGKVFTRKELQMIADLCIQFNVTAVMDEVYEWITYDDNQHIRMASLPGMYERTITIGSAGKTFSVTGWKCGWAIAPNDIRDALGMAHQSVVYSCATNIQEAVAIAFEHELEKTNDTYWSCLSSMLKNKRDKLAKSLSLLSMKPIIPDGGYFMIADCSELINCIDLKDDDDKRGKDFAFVKWLSRNKLQCIPFSAFYVDQYKHLGNSMMRFCFIKKDETLDAAENVLKNLKIKYLDTNNVNN